MINIKHLDLQLDLGKQEDNITDTEDPTNTARNRNRSTFYQPSDDEEYQPLTTRIEKAKSLMKFRSEKAKKKFDFYKKQKVKKSLPNLRTRKLMILLSKLNLRYSCSSNCSQS